MTERGKAWGKGDKRLLPRASRSHSRSRAGDGPKPEDETTCARKPGPGFRFAPSGLRQRLMAHRYTLRATRRRPFYAAGAYSGQTRSLPFPRVSPQGCIEGVCQSAGIPEVPEKTSVRQSTRITNGVFTDSGVGKILNATGTTWPGRVRRR